MLVFSGLARPDPEPDRGKRLSNVASNSVGERSQIMELAVFSGHDDRTSLGATGARRPQAVLDRVTNGKGVMPSFKSKLSAAQIQAVAKYVSSVAGK